VNVDGTFSVDNGVALDYGITTSTGDFMMLVDADHTDGDD